MLATGKAKEPGASISDSSYRKGHEEFFGCHENNETGWSICLHDEDGIRRKCFFLFSLIYLTAELHDLTNRTGYDRISKPFFCNCVAPTFYHFRSIEICRRCKRIWTK